jgi:hypothetical protein
MSHRTPSKLSTPGPYLAEVTNHLDNTAMGGLEVVLKTRITADHTNKQNTYTVKYMTPFYGVTSHRFLGSAEGGFNATQKSYGMWMVPPDVGTTVMVIFVDSDPNQGYWIGCIPDFLQNNMVPGIAASTNFTDLKTAQEKKDYKDASALPVGEYNKLTSELPTNAKRPVHPFASVLANQGLILDDIRGVTSSSARREQPSMVFGISTPGPLDQSAGAPRRSIGYGGGNSVTMPVSRLGGSTFVMDDGDIDGKNELIRLRTRTGHQILMHNTADLIYIANAKGTAWLEFTSDGKIDIYAADSVSIHTEGDFNFKADRDFNLHASRNFNVYAENEINLNANATLNTVAGSIATYTPGGYSLAVDEDHNITVGNNSSLAASGRISIVSLNSVAIESDGEIALYTTSTIAIDSPKIIERPGGRSIESIGADPKIPAGVNLFTIATPPLEGYRDASPLAAMARVPLQEPWTQHENLDPAAFSKLKTDSTLDGIQVSPPKATPTSTSKTPTSKISAKGSAATGRSKPGVDKGAVGNVPNPWTTDTQFLTKIKEVSSRLNFKPIDVLSIMSVETGYTFDPAIRNKQPGQTATGLIQFLESTIAGLSGGQVDKEGKIIKPGSVNTAKLSTMTRVEQMEWVEKYFRGAGWPNNSVQADQYNLYLTIFLPAFKFSKGVLATKDAAGIKGDWYEKNKGLYDKGNTGEITVAEVSKVVDAFKKDTILTLKNAGLDENLDKIPGK